MNHEGSVSSSSVEEEEEDVNEAYTALHIAAFGKPQENEKQEEEEEMEGPVTDSSYISVLDSAKKSLKEILLKNERYSQGSVHNMMRYFNAYLDEEAPFTDCRTTDPIGFSLGTD